MELIDADNAAAYLTRHGHALPGEKLEIRELAGGVSNIVLLVRRSNGDELVIKQARPQLRVPQPWFCGVDRVLREIDVLGWCARVLSTSRGDDDAPPALLACTPRILFEDRANYLFAMTAAPAPHTTWKEQLLAGHTNPEIATACGHLLGQLHAGTWDDAAVARDLDDRQFYDDLRLDPYYRQVGRVHVDLGEAIERLLQSVWQTRLCLVHGDFSPKNLLVWKGGLMLIDFEVGHFGDPAFDLGFFLTHLVLKSFRAGADYPRYWQLVEEFWQAYARQLSLTRTDDEIGQLESRTAVHLAGCLLARVDGKSQVNYLASAEPVRVLARELFRSPPPDWSAVKAVVTDHLGSAQ